MVHETRELQPPTQPLTKRAAAVAPDDSTSALQIREVSANAAAVVSDADTVIEQTLPMTSGELLTLRVHYGAT